MKNKILSYLLVGLFSVFIGGFIMYVEAAGSNGNSTEEQVIGGGNGGGNGGGGGEAHSDNGGQGGCGEVPAGQYCCDGVVTNMPCDSVVITPGCDCSGITDAEAQYKCMQQCSEKGEEECKDGCCGIKLNTNFPIIGNCIGDKESENPTNAFPTMIGAITKIVMSLIFVVCFILIIISGIMRASDNPSGAKNLLKKVAVTILILGLSGVILRLINPNFFS